MSELGEEGLNLLSQSAVVLVRALSETGSMKSVFNARLLELRTQAACLVGVIPC